MIIEHFMGKEECKNICELNFILNKKTEKGVNEFIISLDSQYPFMIMAVNNNKACLSYFRFDDDPGFSSINNMADFYEDDITVFYTNTDEEEIEVENNSIISIEQAIKAIEEFFITNQLPKCVDWEEL